MEIAPLLCHRKDGILFFSRGSLAGRPRKCQKNHLRLWECRILSTRLNLRLELQYCSMLTSCIETRLVQCCVTSLKVRQQYETQPLEQNAYVQILYTFSKFLKGIQLH